MLVGMRGGVACPLIMLRVGSCLLSFRSSVVVATHREALASADSLSPSQSPLDVEERGLKRPKALVRVLPDIDLGAALLDEGRNGLGIVRGLEGSTEHALYPHAVQGQGLLQALGETRGDSGIRARPASPPSVECASAQVGRS